MINTDKSIGEIPIGKFLIYGTLALSFGRRTAPEWNTSSPTAMFEGFFIAREYGSA
jgi:hypothetical protein